MKIYSITLATILCTIQMLVQICKCNNLTYLSDIADLQPIFKSEIKPILFEVYKQPLWFARSQAQPHVYEDEKDSNLKQKIGNLLNQTMIDTQKRIRKIDVIRAAHREEPPYKVGFILCMIKKSKNVMDELFNVAVKHKEQWKSLQHLKVFELIMHTNVDSTNLLRQLVDVHLKNVNSVRNSKY